MPRSNPRRRKGHGEVVPPLQKLERITELLQIQLETFPQKELTLDEITRWEQDLSAYPIEAIEFAFECHRQLAMFFPVPAQILELCKTWEPPGQSPLQYKSACSDECKSRHGKGYGENDLLYLWKRYTVERGKLNRKLTGAEVNLLLDDLDKKRGHAPEWRT